MGTDDNEASSSTEQGSSQPEKSESRKVCPLASSEDKFEEANYFCHQMHVEYHYPQRFRYCLNAFLSALYSVVERVRVDMERVGEAAWLKVNRSTLVHDDEVLAKFGAGRNIVVHQRDIAKGSFVQYGLFRFNKIKFTSEVAVSHDAPSIAILKYAQEVYIGKLLDEEHSEIGMQIGVKRMYRFPELSSTEDAFSASVRAMVRMSNLLKHAHAHLGIKYDTIDDSDIDAKEIVENINLLQEVDVDPDLISKWGWDSDD